MYPTIWILWLKEKYIPTIDTAFGRRNYLNENEKLSIIEAILGSHWIVEQPSVHITMSFHKKSDKRLELWKINQRIDRSEKSLKYILIV